MVIGDIHGALRALEQLIERAEVKEDDRLVFLGDFVDGWSQSFEVIQYLLKLRLKTPCVFIKGNHDLWCQQWLENHIAGETWIYSGGKATLASYFNRSAREKSIHLEFFRELRNYYVDEENRLYIHAGFSSQHGPHKEHYSSNYSWDRTLWEMALCMDKKLEMNSPLYPKRLSLFHEIFIGHTPTLRYGCLEPMNAANVWNLDTGAAFHGRLSMLDVSSKQFWQSDMVQNLYPEERGRNNE